MYAFEMGLCGMIYIPSFMKIGTGVEGILRFYLCARTHARTHTHTHTHTHTEEVYSYFYQNKESMLKILGNCHI
jgi:hypothetical protein